MGVLFGVFSILVSATFIPAMGATTELFVNVPANTPFGDQVFLSADFISGCFSKADCIELHKVEESTYFVLLNIPDGIETPKVLINRGSWERQAAWPGADPVGGMEISAGQKNILNVLNWTDKPKMGITGKVHYKPHFYSPQLKNHRDVSIWVPQNYGRDLSRRYPVIYLHDGQNAFNPDTSFLGVDWGVDEAMTELASKNPNFEAIVVAVDCTEDREAEYDYSQKGARYADFLIHTLKPLIDSEYRTHPERDSTFLMGSSMGALISATILWHHPETFSKAAGLSFAVHFDSGSIFRILENAPMPGAIKLYADYGDAGDDTDYEPWVTDFYRWLLQKGFPKENLTFKKFPYAEHNEAAWARRVATPLRFLLGG